MTTFTVTTTADTIDPIDGKLSLREAVRAGQRHHGRGQHRVRDRARGKNPGACPGRTDAVKQDVTIDGDRNNDGTEVTLSGGDASRILHVAGNSTDVALTDLRPCHGPCIENDNGGGILANCASLNLHNCVLSQRSSVYGSGRELLWRWRHFCYGQTSSQLRLTVQILNCSVAAERGFGGGICGQSAHLPLNVTNATFRDNSMAGDTALGEELFTLTGKRANSRKQLVFTTTRVVVVAQSGRRTGSLILPTAGWRTTRIMAVALVRYIANCADTQICNTAL